MKVSVKLKTENKRQVFSGVDSLSESPAGDLQLHYREAADIIFLRKRWTKAERLSEK